MGVYKYSLTFKHDPLSLQKLGEILEIRKLLGRHPSKLIGQKSHLKGEFRQPRGSPWENVKLSTPRKASNLIVISTTAGL